VNPRERERFDRLLEEVLDQLPPRLHALIEEAPLIVEDHPSEELKRELGVEHDDELCGLHTGIPLTERSVEHPEMEFIHIFREGIIQLAGGWDTGIDEEGLEIGGVDAIREEIRVTVLHEIGHHFGLDEDDLEQLGYA
jgi:predicted Zn-dependent protease with MMP-like domain